MEFEFECREPGLRPDAHGLGRAHAVGAVGRPRARAPALGAQARARQRQVHQRPPPAGPRRRRAFRLLPPPDLRAVVRPRGLQRLPRPEVVDTRRPTLEADVYSLGVLLLELLTGKSPTHASLQEGDGGTLDLPRWVQSVVREEWTAEVFDVELVRLGASAEEEMVALLQVAMACVATVPDARPERAGRCQDDRGDRGRPRADHDGGERSGDHLRGGAVPGRPDIVAPDISALFCWMN
ncbi:putative inactive receptor kinase [Hordeum vulgare]|nr:putative inactive receptor kinase [Hordeum vulgare]